ncbi:hypothetical protein HBI70_108790 [Parastagonospora nodorum]|nr:hypothetical protein HBH50_132400 [Parastagonospora nodorum]KAH4086917.1 hypothetical protein HBH48_141820 [Parastagonospora nodorum]KAH4410549.1 hypothetical protein HBH92_120710 [Parastagonospora nodorum]KAH4430620.1 hypothetical protein HBH93_152430 [Parastagonospora nodorum]KAH4442740.1 hypothetical protein HBH91_162770 [Parastagonospora nodorum]
MPDNDDATGHARPQHQHQHQPEYTYTASDASPSQSPLTGRNPNFLDGLLPPYNPPPGSPDRIDYDSFYDAYRAVTPPLPNFLDNILNPAGLAHNRFSPFGYRPTPPSVPSPSNFYEMPPTTRANPQGSRPARLPNGYVDLTSDPVSPPRTRKRNSPEPGPSSKRQKRDDGTTSRRGSGAMKMEEVDLTEEAPVQDVLQKQREDAVKAQTKPEEKPTTFNTFNCVICMDMPTDLTATACGHLFCHTCLMEALIAGENRAGPGEPKRSQCPVCRKFINRNKITDVIPLMLKKGLATQPRKKRATASPAAVAPKVH